MGVIFPAKSDFALVHADEPAVGNGDPVGIAREILQDMLWPVKGLLGIDNPFVPEQRVQESGE